jgi:hypothetical protein
MPGSSTTIYLPYATTVKIQAFVNAAWQERFTITPPSGPAIVFAGTGFFDTMVGQTSITTPPKGSSSRGAPVTIVVDHSADGGRTWQPSQVASATCRIMSYGMCVVASEDSGDDTWDDATLYFTWASPAKAAAISAPAMPAATAAASTMYRGRA